MLVSVPAGSMTSMQKRGWGGRGMLLTSNRCSIGERRNTSRAKSLLSRAVMGSVKDMSLRVLSKLRKIVCQT